MEITKHRIGQKQVAEVVADEITIKTTEDGLDLLGDIYYQGYDKVIIRREHISPAFFELRTGMAGEILQKFSTYGVKLAIVGDFSNEHSKSLRDFIYESNKTGHTVFVNTIAEAIK